MGRFGEDGQEIEAAVGVYLTPYAVDVCVDGYAAGGGEPIAGWVFVPSEARDASFEAAEAAGQQGLEIFVHHVARAAHEQAFGTERVLAAWAGEERLGGDDVAGRRIVTAGGGEREQARESGGLAGTQQGGGAFVLLVLVFRGGSGVADVFIGQADDRVGAGLLTDGPADGGGGFHRNRREGERSQASPGHGHQGGEDGAGQKVRGPDRLDRPGERVAVERLDGAGEGAIQAGLLGALVALGRGLARFGTPAVVVENGTSILGSAELGGAGHGFGGEANAIGIAPVVGDGFGVDFDPGIGVGLEIAAIAEGRRRWRRGCRRDG